MEETDRQFLSADLNGDGVSDIIRIAPVKVTTAVVGTTILMYMLAEANFHLLET